MIPILTWRAAGARRRARLQTLLSVDDILIELFALLGEAQRGGGNGCNGECNGSLGEAQRGGGVQGGAAQGDGALENTYVMLTSDHGFHMGQFCLGPCKRQPYDTDIRIPFLVRGPGVPTGGTVAQVRLR